MRLKNHHRRSFQAGGGASKFCISSNEKVRLRTIFLRNVDEAVVCEFWKRSMRVYSDAKVHFERNYALFWAFQPSRVAVPRRATDFEFYFIFFVCLFDTLRFVRRLIEEDRFYVRRSRPKDNEICFASFLREKTKNKISLCCCVSALSNNINNNNNWQNRWYLLLFTSQQGTKSKGGQAGVGYKGSTEAGSAPKRRDGKAGYVYSLGVRNGKANVDEYSPIYLPEEFKTDGDKYEGNLLYWAATLAGIIGSGALAIYLTSAL